MPETVAPSNTDRPSPGSQPAADRPAGAGKRRDRRYELGPHSRLFSRGAIGRMNGNSVEAKFIKTIEAALVAHLGGSPSVAQKLLIRRVARAMLQLELLDLKHPLTDHDLRLASSLDGRVRCGLKVLGMQATPPPAPTLDEIAAEIVANRESTA